MVISRMGGAGGFAGGEFRFDLVLALLLLVIAMRRDHVAGGNGVI